MKKFVIAVVCGLLLLVALPTAPAQAYVEDMGYLADFGDLVKLENDFDPTTSADEAVYYIDNDLKRRPFPNRRIYESWYEDFSEVQEITLEEMSRIRLGGNVTYRPGTRLIKIPSVPRVYAVEPGGRLRWLETEDIARQLYGDNWAQRVDDVSEAFFVGYEETVPLTAPVWPTGTVIRRNSDTAIFVIDGAGKRHVAPGMAVSNRLQERHIINTDSDLSEYFDKLSINQAELRLIDTGSYYVAETLPPASFDFPVEPEPQQLAGEDATFYVFRLTVGEPVIVRQLSVQLDGPLWRNNQPMISNLRFENLHGNNLFGIKQLESAVGANIETVSITGAYTTQDNDSVLMRLRGTLSPDLPADSTFTANFIESEMTLGDGGSGDELESYWRAEEFPAQQISISN